MQKVKKLKKMPQILVGGALAVLVAASPALAATAPVVFNGDALGSAELQGGRTYLPFRVIFEACGATVDWDAETKTVMAVQDGRVLTMQVGQKTVDVGGASYTLDAAPYVKNGRTYVPVRFVSETLGYDVIWDQDAGQVNITAPLLQYHDGDSHYSLNLKNGEIVLRQGTTHTVLGVCDIEKSRNYNFSSMQVSKTAGGNYLVDAGIWTSGAMTVNGDLYTWINADTGESYTVNDGGSFSVDYDGEHYESHTPKPMVDDDGCLWLCGINDEYESEAYQIDDINGKPVKEWPIGDMLPEMTGEDTEKIGVVEWANDEYMLFSSVDTMKWGLVNLPDGKVTDITDVLLTDEVIKQMDDKVRPCVEPFLREDWTYDENYRDYFWGGLTGYAMIESHAAISFVKESDGVLYFRLDGRMVDAAKYQANELTIELEYALK